MSDLIAQDISDFRESFWKMYRGEQTYDDDVKGLLSMHEWFLNLLDLIDDRAYPLLHLLG